MSLFEFRLNPDRPLRRDDGTLQSWFWLTDGRFWIDAAGREIFRLSEGEYLDYYVVRLWEDILEVLPHALEPVPAAFLAKLRDLPQWLAFNESVRAWAASDDARSDEEAEVAWRLGAEGTGWFADRRLDTTYLKHAPSIWFWREGDTITITFRTSHRSAEDGTAIWSAGDGQLTMRVDEFLREFVSFHETFMREMQALVERLAHEYGGETNDLVREQALRAAMVTPDALRAKATRTDWAAVGEAVRRLETALG